MHNNRTQKRIFSAFTSALMLSALCGLQGAHAALEEPPPVLLASSKSPDAKQPAAAANPAPGAPLLPAQPADVARILSPTLINRMLADPRGDDAADADGIKVDEPSEAEALIANGLVGDGPMDEEDNTAQPFGNNEDSGNLWGRIRSGFALPAINHPRIDAERDWYANRQDYLDRTFRRARPYLYHIVEEIERRGMPMELALLPVVESAFQPFAHSRAAASGIWQFIPGTASRFGLQMNWWYDGRRDVVAATNAALNYLDNLGRLFGGDWLLALAAYNSGERTVQRAIERNLIAGLPTSFWDLQLPLETQAYVPKLLAVASLIANPNNHGIALKRIPNRPYMAAVEVDKQLDLSVAARLAGMSIEEIYTLNPGFSRFATSPHGPHRLLLPISRIEQFKNGLARLGDNERMRLTHHRVRRGETLAKIARRYGVSELALREHNKIAGKRVRVGADLVIPSAMASLATYGTLSTDTSPRLTKKDETDSQGKKIVYTVRSGDTLWKISRRHGVSVADLRQWNHLSAKHTVKRGEKLTLWQGKTELAKADKNDDGDSSSADKSRAHEDRGQTKKAKGKGKNRQQLAGNDDQTGGPRKVSYRVRKGDSLSRISQRFNVSVSDLKEWNPKTSADLKPGLKLVVYINS